MKKLLTILALMLVAFAIGCKDSKYDNRTTNGPKSENIQNTFFGTSFGSSKEEVIENFENHGLRFIQRISSDANLDFQPVNSEFITFGNMSWKGVKVGLNNNKFCNISFYSPYNEKHSAMTRYNDILSVLSKKYAMSEEETEDTTIYANFVGYGKNKSRVIVRCLRYESIYNESWYGAMLLYVNDSIANELSDEL